MRKRGREGERGRKRKEERVRRRGKRGEVGRGRSGEREGGSEAGESG